MSPIAYTVTATLPDEQTAEAYLLWLREGHVAEVLRAGAASAAIVRITEPDRPVRVETRYVFVSRQEYDRYVRHAAPRLRAEGAQRFGPGSGVTFARTVGELVPFHLAPPAG